MKIFKRIIILIIVFTAFGWIYYEGAVSGKTSESFQSSTKDIINNQSRIPLNNSSNNVLFKVRKVYNTPNEIIKVYNDFLVFEGNTPYNQAETIVTADFNNPDVLFGSAMTICQTKNCGEILKNLGFYVSTNGGANWSGSDQLWNESAWIGDPSPIIDANGRLILTYLEVTENGNNLIASYSTDGGANFSDPVTIASHSSTQNPDKNMAATEDNSFTTIPRSFVAWTNWAATPFPRIELSYTTNGGVNWVSRIPVISNPQKTCMGVDISTAPSGDIYLIWSEIGTGGDELEDYACFAISTDRGDNWNPTENIFDRNGPFPFTRYEICVNGYTRIAVDKSSFGTRSGWIYVVTGEKGIYSAEDPDIIFHRSTDGGSTWSGGIRVNQDNPSESNYQWLPAICLDENGGIDIVYFDDRDRASGDPVNVYLSRSTDGGNNWTDVRISSSGHTPEGIPEIRTCNSTSNSGYWAGDYIGITSSNGNVIPFWADNRTGRYQVYCALVEIDKK